MATVTIPKIEYLKLKKIAKRYQTIVRVVGFDVPQESLKDYANAPSIRKAYVKALKDSAR